MQVAVASMTGVGQSIGHHEYEYNHYPTPQAGSSPSQCPILFIVHTSAMVNMADFDASW